MSLKTFRALRACIAGGVYRRPGEVFAMNAPEKAPEHLEAVEDSLLEAGDGDTTPKRMPAIAPQPAPVTANEGPGKDKVPQADAEAAKTAAKPGRKPKVPETGKPAPVTANEGATLENIGGAKVVNVADVTSADMIPKV